MFSNYIKSQFGGISHQLIQAMQPTLSDFYEIWYACRTFPDSQIYQFLQNQPSGTEVMSV